MHKPMHSLVGSAVKSWHVVAQVGGLHATKFEVVDHTHREEVATNDWFEIYNSGELIIECTTIAKSAVLEESFQLSACGWYEPNAVFEMQVSHVTKEVAVIMFTAAYTAAMESEQ